MGGSVLLVPPYGVQLTVQLYLVMRIRLCGAVIYCLHTVCS
jgi:hypothetical protein